MDLASCTTSAVPCDDTGTSGGVWHLVAQVLLVLLVGLVAWWLVRHRLRRPVRVPQRRAHVSADGALVRVEELRRG